MGAHQSHGYRIPRWSFYLVDWVQVFRVDSSFYQAVQLIGHATKWRYELGEDVEIADGGVL